MLRQVRSRPTARSLTHAGAIPQSLLQDLPASDVNVAARRARLYLGPTSFRPAATRTRLNQKREVTEYRRAMSGALTRIPASQFRASDLRFWVELRGLEPLTPTLPVWCATSCAIAPRTCANRSYTTVKKRSKSQ